jgi:hypothetical protein
MNQNARWNSEKKNGRILTCRKYSNTVWQEQTVRMSKHLFIIPTDAHCASVGIINNCFDTVDARCKHEDCVNVSWTAKLQGRQSMETRAQIHSLNLCNALVINDLYGWEAGPPDTKSFNLDRYKTQFTVARLV